MISILGSEVIIAVDKKAEDTLQSMNYECKYVRHPARGGQKNSNKVLLKSYQMSHKHELQTCKHG
jgi:hypothetical protein